VIASSLLLEQQWGRIGLLAYQQQAVRAAPSPRPETLIRQGLQTVFQTLACNLLSPFQAHRNFFVGAGLPAMASASSPQGSMASSPASRLLQGDRVCNAAASVHRKTL
jgi:hypothetical protein